LRVSHYCHIAGLFY